MDILGLSTSPSSGGAFALILNEVNGSRRLPIIIGTYEAQAIALELEHIKPPRPMTHDLLKQVIESCSSTVKYVLINDLREGTFFSQIILEGLNGDILVDSRPSDAIALAIRFSAPIFVATTVLNEAGIVSDAADNDNVSTFEAKPTDEKTKKSKDVQSSNPETRIQLLQKNLNDAIAAEDYELAARLRDELERLKG
jgi:bifunctional DNase/RNase